MCAAQRFRHGSPHSLIFNAWRDNVEFFRVYIFVADCCKKKVQGEHQFLRAYIFNLSYPTSTMTHSMWLVSLPRTISKRDFKAWQ